MRWIIGGAVIHTLTNAYSYFVHNISSDLYQSIAEILLNVHSNPIGHLSKQ